MINTQDNLLMVFIDDEPIIFSFDYVTVQVSDYNLRSEESTYEYT